MKARQVPHAAALPRVTRASTITCACRRCRCRPTAGELSDDNGNNSKRYPPEDGASHLALAISGARRHVQGAEFPSAFVPLAGLFLIRNNPHGPHALKLDWIIRCSKQPRRNRQTGFCRMPEEFPSGADIAVS
jgi:hypothetical protein